jgi:hypothetical protein
MLYYNHQKKKKEGRRRAKEGKLDDKVVFCSL